MKKQLRGIVTPPGWDLSPSQVPPQHSFRLPQQFTSTNLYYMSSSMSGQDEPNPALWLVTWVGKRDLSCPLRTETHYVPQEKFPQMPYHKSFIDQAKHLVKMSWYWPCSFLEFMDLHKKRNSLANIQPSWLHIWSIIHLYHWVEGGTVRVGCFALEQTTSTLARTQTTTSQSIDQTSCITWMLNIGQKHIEWNMIGMMNKNYAQLSFDCTLHEHLPTNLAFW